MPLGTREVLLVIRARDQATRAITGIASSFGALDAEAAAAARSTIATGTALTGVGIGIGAVGVAGLAFMKQATDAAMDYNRQAALTLTQVDQTGVKLEDIKRIGRDVAEAIPAPFDQMQKSLFDIFSSMDVNTTQAQQLLTAFSKAAVAGQTDVQTAGRATISIMNGFKVPIQDVGKVMDVQFETVKKGVITYDELASTIGRAIPSAVKAGQSYQTLGGMIAFLTRNGLSAAMASTSAARAFDLLSNPKFADNMQKFGISVFDASGNFRPMVDVVTDLRNKLAGLTPEEAAAKLKELTTGAGGTIQAMRFLNLAVNDSNGLLGELTDQVTNSQGAMGSAYDIMFNQPASQSQLFKNNLDVLKTEIGDALIPTLNELLKHGIEILKWFEDMDPHTREMITRFAALGFAILVLAGIVLTLVGAFVILNGVLQISTGMGLGGWLGEIASKAVGVAVLALAVWGLVHAFQAIQDNDVMGTVIGLATAFLSLAYAFATFDALAGITAAVAAALSIPFILAAALIAAVVIAVLALAYVIYRNWNTIRDVTIEVWGIVWGWMQTVWDKMQEFWNWIANTAENIWGHLKDVVIGAWNGMVSAWEHARDIFVSVVGTIVGWVQQLWKWITTFASWFWGTFGPGFMNVLHAIGGFFSDVGAQIVETVTSIWSRLMWFWSGFMTVFVPVFWWFRDIVMNVWDVIYQIISNDVSLIWNVFTSVLGPAIDFVRDIFNLMLNDATLVWNSMWVVISTAIGIIQTIIEFTVGVIMAIWNNFGSVIWQQVVLTWNLITGVISTVITLIKDIITFVLNLIQGDWAGAWNSIKQFFSDAWYGIWGILQTVWGFIRNFFIEMPGAILGFLGDFLHLLWDKGRDLLNGLWGGIQEIWHNISVWLTSLYHFAKDAVGDLGRILWDAGRAIINGLWGGMKEVWNDVTGWLSNLDPRNWKGPKERDLKMLHESGQFIMQGLKNGSQQGWDEYTNWLSTLDPAQEMQNQFSMGGLGGGQPLTSYNVHQWAEGAIQVNGAGDPVEIAKQVHAQFNEVVNERIMQGVQ